MWCRCGGCLCDAHSLLTWCCELRLKDCSMDCRPFCRLGSVCQLLCATYRTAVEDVFKTFLCMCVCNLLKPYFFVCMCICCSFFILEIVPTIPLCYRKQKSFYRERPSCHAGWTVAEAGFEPLVLPLVLQCWDLRLELTCPPLLPFVFRLQTLQDVYQ